MQLFKEPFMPTVFSYEAFSSWAIVSI